MGRPSTTRSLAVWMNRERVGLWSARPQSRHEFRYDASWLESDAARPISISLPLAPAEYAYTGEQVEAFFDNLLPDSADIRRRIRQRYGAASTSPFDLLSEIGRDCVGAVQLLAPEESPMDVKRIDGRELTDAEIETVLRNVPATRLGAQEGDEGFRISLAGAQEKTALLRIEDRWLLPSGSTPTTHILKLPLGRIGTMGVDMSLSIENEWLCSRIVQAMGFQVARCEVARFGEQKALIVERFDRRRSPDGSWILRLPQEDLCQALGVPPGRKYESEGGPGIEEIMSLLRGARDPIQDREIFLRVQILFWLLAASDGHAKNFSVFLERGGQYRLAPLYDIMSAYPILGHGAGRIPEEKLKMAMAAWGKSRHYEWRKIEPRHWIKTASDCGLAGSAEGMLGDMAARVPAALESVARNLPSGFPAEISDSILEHTQKSAELLKNG